MKEIKQLDKNTVSIGNVIYYKVSKRSIPNIVLVNNETDTFILGEIIRETRKHKNMTQGELASKCKLNIASINRAESSELKDVNTLITILTTLELIIVL